MPETPHWTAAIHLGIVTATDDPEGRGRLRVRLPGLGLELWAAVLIPASGVALTPRPDDTVAISFAGGEPAHPLILGALWTTARPRPAEAGQPDQSYAVVTPAGARLVLDDAAGPTVTLDTGTGTRLSLEGSLRVTLEVPGSSLRLEPADVEVTSANVLSLSASKVTISASMVQIDAGMVRVSGVVQCDTLITNAVVSASYTPGAGNIW